jgi:hypothetical protein
MPHLPPVSKQQDVWNTVLGNMPPRADGAFFHLPHVPALDRLGGGLGGQWVYSFLDAMSG